MGKQVEVILEGFGRKNLKRVVDAEEIRGKPLGDVIEYMLKQKWEGEDMAAYNSIARKIQTTSGKYTPQVARGGILIGEPVKFVPSRVIDAAEQYIQPIDGNQGQLRISITPSHKTA